MAEFSLALENVQPGVVESFASRLDGVLRDPYVTQVTGQAELKPLGDGSRLLVVDVSPVWPVVTIYWGLSLLVAGLFGVLALGFSWWILVPGAFFTLSSVGGSSYWYAFVWIIPRLRKAGYRGRIRLYYAQGVF